MCTYTTSGAGAGCHTPTMPTTPPTTPCPDRTQTSPARRTPPTTTCLASPSPARTTATTTGQFDLTYLYFKQTIFRLFLLDFKARQYPCRASEKLLCKNVSFPNDPLLSSTALNLHNHQGSGSPLMCSTKPVFKGGECTLAG